MEMKEAKLPRQSCKRVPCLRGEENESKNDGGGEYSLWTPPHTRLKSQSVPSRVGWYPPIPLGEQLTSEAWVRFPISYLLFQSEDRLVSNLPFLYQVFGLDESVHLQEPPLHYENTSNPQLCRLLWASGLCGNLPLATCEVLSCSLSLPYLRI